MALDCNTTIIRPVTILSNLCDCSSCTGKTMYPYLDYPLLSVKWLADLFSNHSLNDWKFINTLSSMKLIYWFHHVCQSLSPFINTLRPRQNGRHFADDTFKRIFLNENVRISIKISLKFVPEGPINNIPELVQIMAWRRPGDKPLSKPMMIRLLTHICVTRPQWVNRILCIS